ncbi:MAG: hypothetical protein ACYCZO_01700 [Daejeonella sp.]
MKIILSVFIGFYLFGASIILPMGDFAILSEYSSLYRHCQQHEDKDMGLEDFITQHLFNLTLEDPFERFDSKGEENDKIPHTPVQNTYQASAQSFIVYTGQFTLMHTFTEPVVYPAGIKLIYTFDYQSGVFRPPVNLSV